MTYLIRQDCASPRLSEDRAVGLSQRKLNLAITYINDRLSQNLSLAEMADQLNMSQYHFCRLFKQSTGSSPYQYLLQQRVEWAKQLLIEGKMSIVDVAIAVGFSDQSQLSYHVKRRLGITPRQLMP
jgi:AraC family transcriptional regulator